MEALEDQNGCLKPDPFAGLVTSEVPAFCG